MATDEEFEELRRRVTQLEAYAVMSRANFVAVAGTMTPEQRTNLARGLEQVSADAPQPSVPEEAEFQAALRGVALSFAQELRVHFGIGDPDNVSTSEDPPR